MAVSAQLNECSKQTAQCDPARCKSCKRTGIPILPLRKAVTPIFGKRSISMEASGFNESLRMLRAGYLYVLLDGKVWQAYQVTYQGALRQFDPLQSPPLDADGNIPPLPESCISNGDEVAAAFLNISGNYKKAQIAFANDPWPKEVLNAYRTGKSPMSRFATYDIAKLKSDPSSAGADNDSNAMGLTQVTELGSKVWEFVANSVDFHSVHGFYARAHRVAAMQAFVTSSVAKYQFKKGVPVLILPDAVGMVQEYNSLRVYWMQQLQNYAGDPENQYKCFTSQALLKLREVEAEWAKQEGLAAAKEQVKRVKDWNSNPVLANKAALPPVNVGQVADRVAKEKTKAYHRRLEDAYDESLRNKFQTAYDNKIKYFESQIDAFGKHWDRWCGTDSWMRQCEHDYDGDNLKSGSCHAYANMMAICIAGGPSGAPAKRDPKDPKKPPLLTDATQKRWEKWLRDPKSPVYQALLAKNKSFLAGLMPSSDGLNDSSKLYGAIRTAVESKDIGGAFLQPKIKHTAGVLLMAVNSAAISLSANVGEEVSKWVRNLNIGCQYLYSRTQPTRFQVDLTLTEYMSLLSESLHRGMESGGKKVRSLLLGGLISIPNPKLRNTVIKVTGWAMDSAESIGKRLRDLAGKPSGEALAIGSLSMRSLVMLETFDPAARKFFQAVKVRSSDAVKFTQITAVSMHRRSGPQSLLFSAVALWMSYDSLKQSMDSVKTTVGAAYPEAELGAVSASIGALAAVVETVGVSLKAFSSGARTAARMGGASRATVATLKNVADVGGVLVKGAGYVFAALAFLDAAQSVMMAKRARAQGDKKAEIAYQLSWLMNLGAGGLGIYVVYTGGVLLAPLAGAVILGLAAYVLTRWGKSQEATPVEMWARRCVFGTNKGNSASWKTPGEAGDAVAALNAALLGFSIDTNTEHEWDTLTSTGGIDVVTSSRQALKYRIVMPNFDPVTSAYAYAVTVTRRGGGSQVLTGGHKNMAPLANIQPPTHGVLDYEIESPRFDFSKNIRPGDPMVVSGKIYINPTSKIDVVSIVARFYKDRVDDYGFAEVSYREKLQ
ncbi:T6SS effector BTH_I2691 family protein [Burkholderia sp. PR2]|uniref:T6SS effector BTH_I2691 family protein n=1 Tax=Burkholderia sp. PR2 TaxID=3448078 RepID=UPI00402A661D